MSGQDLYDELGVSKEASTEDIKRAYRSRSKETHPDAGGDPAEFRALARAYGILSNQESRKRYDRGETPDAIEAGDPDAEAVAIIKSLFIEIVTGSDNPYASPLDEIRKRIGAKQAQGRELIALQRKLIARLEKAKAKLKAKGEENFLTPTLEQQIKIAEASISRVEHELRIGDRVKELVDGYEYEVEKRPPSPQVSGPMFTLEELQRRTFINPFSGWGG